MDKLEELRAPWERVRERDKTLGTEVYQELARREGELKKMYEQSTLRKVASNCALELLWHWINEIRFDGPHSNDSMLMARAAVQVPGQHQMECLALTELAGNGTDVMCGAIRHQLSEMWNYLMEHFEQE